MAFCSASDLGTFLILMGAMVRFSSTVLLGNRLKCWNTMPIFCRWRGRSTFLPVMSTPSNRMEPEVGVSSRFRLRRNVLLPPPEGPITAMTSPLYTSTVTPSSALTSPPL